MKIKTYVRKAARKLKMMTEFDLKSLVLLNIIITL